jgi:hypothetical protein
MTDAAIDKPRLVVPDKSFFVKERDSFYSSWVLSFWRELMQNSVDAGAKTIRITVAETRQKGSFGRTPPPKTATRVIFADDGCGMDAKTLDEVYFRMGGTTKQDDDTSVGGFGRARLMTNFSQVRYSIETRDRFVEGDGAEFFNFSRDEALTSLTRWRDAATARHDADPRSPAAEWHAFVRDDLERDRARLAENPSLEGCRVEIDLPPDQRDRSRNDSSVQGMLNTLQAYLDQSDLKCAIEINGTLYEKPATKYEGRKTLVATIPATGLDPSWKTNPKIDITERPDGDFDVKFATVRTVPDGKCPDSVRYKLVHRVNGASMFTDRTDFPSAIYLEINPVIARTVLTSNRDGLKEPFSGAVEDYKRLLATDSQQATKADRGTEFTVLPGGRGGKTARRRRKDPGISSEEASLIAGAAGDGLSRAIEQQSRHLNYSDWEWDRFLRGDVEGIDNALLMPFLEELTRKSGIDGTFLENYRDRSKAESFQLTLKNAGPHRAMVLSSGTLLAFIVDNLSLQKIAREIVEREVYKDRLADFNDIPILKENIEPPEDRFTPDEARKRRSKLTAAIRRHDPRNWNPLDGQGLKPHRVLAAWQAAVDNVVVEMLEAYPGKREFAYASGWVFSHPQWSYSSLNEEYQWRGPAAMLKKAGKGESAIAHFLLDPLDPDTDFHMKYNPSDANDRDKLITLAAHEAGHVFVDQGHNDAFAEVLTTLMERLTIKERRRIHAEMMASVKAVEKLYSESRTRIVPLDDEPGPRPAQRLAGGFGMDAALESAAAPEIASPSPTF